MSIDQLSDSKLSRLGALAFLLMPVCYLGMFIIFGALLAIPQGADINERIGYVVAEQGLIQFAYLLGYLIFGVLLLVSVQAIHNRFLGVSRHLLNSASLFGFIWVVLMMCAGMIALVGMNTMIMLYSKDPQAAAILFYSYTMVVNALGGGIELVGGMWVLLLSIVGLRSHIFPRLLCWVGFLVGAFGVLTVIPSLPFIKEVFGLTQIVWFIWVGTVLCGHKDS
ncbi:hypothetical protein CWE22_07470 [Pseudidiomarina aestuarii]|uniref:DUF4386 domain-containing protein n=1 Tax=Pseudidiomarina aestuarii TaxID=624146 RepID=A0A7Z6ZVB0_9GAMM|nr:DUF4386 family protein [Pseudidiomarina aestuarii]RUO41973.1 hypothetical protein CWE22_07470 [Pseudidiomarina aestuarii]